MPFPLWPLCMSLCSAFSPSEPLPLLPTLTYPPTHSPSARDQAVHRTLLQSPSAPQHPGPQPASFHRTPHSTTVQSPCPRPTTLVPPPLPSPPVAPSLLRQASGVISPFPRCQVVLFPGAVPPSFPLPLPPLWLVWGRKARRKQQHQE